jgi:GNAT superfamily N-acetyltransferase
MATAAKAPVSESSKAPLLTAKITSLDSADAKILISELHDELQKMYPEFEDLKMNLSPAEVTPPNGVFLIIYDGAVPVGSVALLCNTTHPAGTFVPNTKADLTPTEDVVGEEYSQRNGTDFTEPHARKTIIAAETKRMYVRPSHRGKGVSKRLLQEMEIWAQSQKPQRVERIILQTGVRQVAAHALYERFGYRRIPEFENYYWDPSICFAKDLV